MLNLGKNQSVKRTSGAVMESCLPRLARRTSLSFGLSARNLLRYAKNYLVRFRKRSGFVFKSLANGASSMHIANNCNRAERDNRVYLRGDQTVGFTLSQ